LEGGGNIDVVGDGVVVEGFVVGLGAGEEAEGVFEDQGLADGESGLGSGFEEVGEGEACGPTDGIDVAGEVEGVAEAAKDADAFAEGELEVAAEDAVFFAPLGAVAVLEFEDEGFCGGEGEF
jgi:hypothetical protein